MLRLSHPNVVQGIELPHELKCLVTTDMPVLAMEYCQLGDLRRVTATICILFRVTQLQKTNCD